jgi:hypothetical protein
VVWGLIVIGLLLAGGKSAEAGGWRWRARQRRARQAEQRVPRPVSRPRGLSVYEQQRAYWNRYYPKYVGGFHARYFDTLGVPSGDVGLRGNSLYATPW